MAGAAATSSTWAASPSRLGAGGRYIDYARQQGAPSTVSRSDWRRKWRREGIRVNAVRPAWSTPASMPTALSRCNVACRLFPLRRMAAPEEIAQAIVAARQPGGKLCHRSAHGRLGRTLMAPRLYCLCCCKAALNWFCRRTLPGMPGVAPAARRCGGTVPWRPAWERWRARTKRSTRKRDGNETTGWFNATITRMAVRSGGSHRSWQAPRTPEHGLGMACAVPANDRDGLAGGKSFH